MTLGRPTSAARRSPSDTVLSVAVASSGSTSSETRPSTPPLSWNSGSIRSQAPRMSSIASCLVDLDRRAARRRPACAARPRSRPTRRSPSRRWSGSTSSRARPARSASPARPSVSRLRRMLSYQMLCPSAWVWCRVVCLLAVIWADPLASSVAAPPRASSTSERRDLVDPARVPPAFELRVQPGVDDRRTPSPPAPGARPRTARWRRCARATAAPPRRSRRPPRARRGSCWRRCRRPGRCRTPARPRCPRGRAPRGRPRPPSPGSRSIRRTACPGPRPRSRARAGARRPGRAARSPRDRCPCKVFIFAIENSARPTL